MRVRPALPSDARRWLVVGGLLLIAALIRVATIFYHELSGDDATVALMAKHVLSGEGFPVFFYRQTYMGSVNGLHLVPALFLFGPSVLLVRLNAVAYSLVFPLGLYVLGRRVFDEATARVALGLAAISPFLLTYWSTVAEPHLETNSFGSLLLLLGLAALTARSESRYARVLVCLGLTAGLACWASLKALEILVPVGLLLWLRDPWLPLRRRGALLAGTFLVGSLPAWLFYATRGDPAAHSPGSVRSLFEAGWTLSASRLGDLLLTVPPTVLGTYYWQADTWARQATLALNMSIYGTATGVMLVEVLRLRRRGAPPTRREWGLWLLLLTLITPFALLYAARFEPVFNHESARYVLPVYIPLLLFAGALIARLWRRSSAVATALLAGLLAFNVWTNLDFMWPLHPEERAHRAAHIAERQAIRRHLERHPVEALYTDDQFASLRWAFLLPTAVSELTTEIYVPHAVAADAAGRIGILSVRPDHAVVDQLAALGATYRTWPFGGTLLLDELRVPERDYRLVSRAAWRVGGEPDALSAIADGDLATVWPPAAESGHGELVVDLGASYPVSRVIWWPGTAEADTLPVRVAGSLDRSSWDPIGVAPSPEGRPVFAAEGRPFFRPRNGWLELRLEPRAIRYLRFTPADSQAGRSWGLAELYLYEDAPWGSDGPPTRHALAAALQARGLTRLMADPGLSAQVARATRGAVGTLPANGAVDNYGRAWPPARLGEPVRIRPTDGLLVPREDAEDLRTRLTGEGLRFEAEAVANQVLFHGIAPVVSNLRCRRTTWRLAAEETLAPHESTRYVIEARLQEPQRVVAVRVAHPPPSVRDVVLLTLAVSDDGLAWRAVSGVHRLRDWAWAGRTLFTLSGLTAEVALSPTPAGYVRIELAKPLTGSRPITSLCVRGEPLR